jgi:ABC-type transport system involved in cytochrome bd biosynthesis fused ATPase/permease subunit
MMGSATQLADVGILGTSALMTGLGLVHAGVSTIRTAPQRRTLRDFLEAGARAPRPPAGGSAALSRSLADAVIELDHVSCVHPGASHATPAAVTLRWSSMRGLAVSGPNGAGKSTLALALLGLLAPAEGRLSVDGAPLDALDLDAYRRRIAFVPQGAFFAPGEPVAWHLRLYTPTPVSDERIDEALERVGLSPVLAGRAAREGKPPREVPAGELSGGERQRMHLARAILQDAELVVLDEPEAALDDAGRRGLSTLLERLAERRKVLLIAHDMSIVPASYDRYDCRRGEAAACDRPGVEGMGQAGTAHLSAALGIAPPSP